LLGTSLQSQERVIADPYRRGGTKVVLRTVLREVRVTRAHSLDAAGIINRVVLFDRVERHSTPRIKALCARDRDAKGKHEDGCNGEYKPEFRKAKILLPHIAPPPGVDILI